MREIYLSARFSRWNELIRYREQIQLLGHQVVTGWLDKPERPSFSDFSQEAAQIRLESSRDNCADVARATTFIAFTEEAPSTCRGGRHVEFGLALAFASEIWIVGPRENVFHWEFLNKVFPEWQQCLDYLSKHP